MLGRDGAVLDRDGAVLGRDGAVLGRDDAVLGRDGTVLAFSELRAFEHDDHLHILPGDSLHFCAQAHRRFQQLLHHKHYQQRQLNIALKYKQEHDVDIPYEAYIFIPLNLLLFIKRLSKPNGK